MVTTKKPLGDMLLAARLIGPEDLRRGLAAQRQSDKRLGQVLVEMGLVTAEDVASLLAAQLELPFLPDHEVQADPAAAQLVPLPQARAKGMLPLRVLEDRALVAACDPLDVVSLDEMRRYLQREIDLVVVTDRGLERALAQCERAAPRAGDGTAATAGGAEAEVSSPAVRLVDELIGRALEERASDVHIEPGPEAFRVRLRIDGILQQIMTQSMAQYPAMVARVKVLADLDITERRLPQDGRLELRDRGRNVDIRVSTFPTVHGEKVVLRLFDRGQAICTLAQLGMAEQVLEPYSQAVRKSHGMILVTGPTGSGKTMTLLSTLAELVSGEKSIATVEDPVEYLVAGVNHGQVNPKAGLTFAAGLRAMLRQDPDVIMVGEVRDGETADVAVRAALTGHVVLSTLHTGDAAEAITRLVDMGVEPFLVASALLGVLAQRLVRTLCPRCKRERPVDVHLFERCGVAVPANATCYAAGKCARCRQTGYSGRTAIFEFLPMTSAIQDLAHQRATTVALRRQARAEGMPSLVAAGLERVLAGLTTPEEVFRVIDAPLE